MVATYEIAVIVLRGYRNTLDGLPGTVGEALTVLDAIRPGEVIYVYVDDYLKESDRRKKKGPFS